MLALYKQAIVGAIRAYDRCVMALDDELDVDPMPETQALYDKIQNLELRRLTPPKRRNPKALLV